MVVVPSPLISRLRSSHAEDQAVFQLPGELMGEAASIAAAPATRPRLGWLQHDSVQALGAKFLACSEGFGIGEWEEYVSKVGFI